MAVKSNKQATVLRYVKFCYLNLNDYSDEQIAQNLEFGSPEALYQRLSEDGFPVCPVCGETPIVGPHCEKSPAKPKCKARTSGEAIELPPAKAAKPLFRKALESLTDLVETRRKPLPKPLNFMEVQFMVEGLDTLTEYLQGELFVSSLVEEPRRDELGTHYREYYSPEKWQELCENLDVSPAVEIISERILEEGLTTSPVSAQQRHPADMLVKLIGMYVLAGEPLEPLVEKLNPEPQMVDMRKLEKYLYGYKVPKKDGSEQLVPGMMGRLQQAATLMRGGNVRSGQGPELTEDEMRIAWLIGSFEGRTAHERDEIHKKLLATGLSRDDVDRLADLNPKRPDVESVLKQHVDENRVE